MTIPLPRGLHGAFRNDDFTDAQRRSHLRSGRLCSYGRGVVVDPHRRFDFETRAAAALLFAGQGAVLTGHSTARLFGLTAADDSSIHVIVGYKCRVRDRDGVIFHRGAVDPADTVEFTGLRTVLLPAAVAEVLCTSPEDVGLTVADQYLAGVEPHHRHQAKEGLAQHVRARPSRRGTRHAQFLLSVADGLAESPTESRILLPLLHAGLPMPERQVAVTDITGHVRYRLDFGWRAAMVALEYDGYAAHVDRLDLDAARDEDLRKRGWWVVHATSDDLRDPRHMIAAIRNAFIKRNFAV